MIVVRSWERAKGLTRIEFLAGGRALADYRRANNTARSVAALFSAGRDDAPGLAERMLEENKDLHRRLRALEEVAARAEATELLTNAVTNNDGVRTIMHIFDNRDSEFLKQVAFAIIKQQHTIALLASRDNDVARLVFARSADALGDMNALMREACGMVDGRGGGKPDFAQGGGKNVDKLEEALKRANAKLADDNLQTV
jgi:alanyl-tRNA synthetase